MRIKTWTTTATILHGRKANFGAALTPEEARVAELYYDVGPRGEMHHNPEKNVLWVAEPIEGISHKLKLREDEAVLLSPAPKANCSKTPAGNAGPRPPSMRRYTWVGTRCSFRLPRSRPRARSRRLPRIRAEDSRPYSCRSVDPARGFLHRVGGPRLEGSLDDQVFTIAALLDAWEITLDRRYFEIAERAMRLAVERFGDPDGGGFFDRAKTPRRWAALKSAANRCRIRLRPREILVAAIVLDRLTPSPAKSSIGDWAEKTLEAFAALAPKYGLFAATYGLAALLHARRALQVVISGTANDPKADDLEKAANEVYRFGKTVPACHSRAARLGPSSRHAPRHASSFERRGAQAFVCVQTTCHPPVADRNKLTSLLTEVATDLR